MKGANFFFCWLHMIHFEMKYRVLRGSSIKGEKCDRHPFNNNSHVHPVQLPASNPTNYEQRRIQSKCCLPNIPTCL